jgi:hypothetical protein
MPQIEIIVTPAGESQVQTLGFAGPACQAASRFVEQALGQVTHQQVTAEFYQQQSTQQSVQTDSTASPL